MLLQQGTPVTGGYLLLERFDWPVVVRGAGDIATGVIQKLAHAGFNVYALEVKEPSAIRRKVALSEAVYDGKTQVEDLVGVLVENEVEANIALAVGRIPILVDPDLSSLSWIRPLAFVDAVIAKKNTGLNKELAPVTIALWPGFTAGEDCDVVIETQRGHDQGMLIFSGQTQKNTGVPGPIEGFTTERVIRAPHAGNLTAIRQIGDIVEAGEDLLKIDDTIVTAPIGGVVRGMLRDGYAVVKGTKLSDIDPRLDEQKNCYTISDKARALGGAVLEAVTLLLRQKQLWP